MTTLREAAQQVLKAVDHALPYAPYLGAFDAVADTANDLRAALAEPVREDAVYWYVGKDGNYHSSNEAKLFIDANTKALHLDPPQWRKDKGDLMPLYTAPPQRKPLTGEEIDKIGIDCLSSPVLEIGWNRHFARAVEHAHGIGGSDE